MLNAVLSILLFFASVVANAELCAGLNTSTPQTIHGLYVNTFGDAAKAALVFVHGGPGDDSSIFECGDAQRLSTMGYFVVVYDQRGQGRSIPATEAQGFDYSTYADDLKSIIDQLNLKRPVLLAHSHGGSVAAHFDEKYPGVVGKIVLIEAPIDLWPMVSDMQNNCAVLYRSVGNDTDRFQMERDVNTITQDSLSVSDANINELTWSVLDLFSKSASCGRLKGLYATNIVTPEAAQLIAAWHSFLVEKVKPQTPAENAPPYSVYGFLRYEDYIRVNYSKTVVKGVNHFYGIYADEDGLFTPASLASIQGLLTSPSACPKFQIIHGASHNVFMDQRDDFNQALLKILACE